MAAQGQKGRRQLWRKDPMVDRGPRRGREMGLPR